MILNEDGEKCSAKDLANEILIRCLEDISSYLREHPDTTELLTQKENNALNDQLVKQATRCFKLLGVHQDDIGQIFDPDDPRSQDGAVNAQTGEEMSDEEKQSMRDALAEEDAMARVPTSVKTMEERREQEIKERNARG